MRRALIFAACLSSLGVAQSWQSTPSFPLPASPIALTRPAQPHMPFTVTGDIGALFGQADGTFEAWVFPVKVASHFRITAELADYPIPIDLQDYASTIEVNPERTTITYSHAAFTVRQHMFSGSDTGPGRILRDRIDASAAADHPVYGGYAADVACAEFRFPQCGVGSETRSNT